MMPQIQDVEGEGCGHLRRILDDVGDALSSAFPEGKQHGEYKMVRAPHYA
jgi:hypothetical protein